MVHHEEHEGQEERFTHAELTRFVLKLEPGFSRRVGSPPLSFPNRLNNLIGIVDQSPDQTLDSGELLRDEVFLRTAWNSVVYTVVAVAIKFVLGLTMALVLDQERRWNNVFRTLLFVPWAVPVVIAWDQGTWRVQQAMACATTIQIPSNTRWKAFTRSS